MRDLTPFEERVFRAYTHLGDWSEVSHATGLSMSAIKRTMNRVYRRHEVNGAVQLFRKLGWFVMVIMAIPVTLWYWVLIEIEERK